MAHNNNIVCEMFTPTNFVVTTITIIKLAYA
jgi:hypothetical protein